jgi:hypothetical protein
MLGGVDTLPRTSSAGVACSGSHGDQRHAEGGKFRLVECLLVAEFPDRVLDSQRTLDSG